MWSHHQLSPEFLQRRPVRDHVSDLLKGARSESLASQESAPPSSEPSSTCSTSGLAPKPASKNNDPPSTSRAVELLTCDNNAGPSGSQDNQDNVGSPCRWNYLWAPNAPLNITHMCFNKENRVSPIFFNLPEHSSLMGRQVSSSLGETPRSGG